MTTFRQWLGECGACEPAREWVGNKSFPQAWDTCESPDWMFWVVKELWHAPTAAQNRALVRCAVASALSVLHLVDPDEIRPILAIKAAALWLFEPTAARAEEARARAAHAYVLADHMEYRDVPVSLAAYAAAAAAQTAVFANSVGERRDSKAILYAAQDAAQYAANGVPGTAGWRAQCDIIRRHLPRTGAR